MIPLQLAVAEVIGNVLSGKNLDRELDSLSKRHQALMPNERAAVQAIAFDTLRHYGLLNAQLARLLKSPITDKPVRCLLLVALSQLQFSKTKPHAIVDHAVSAAEPLGFPRAKALINGVLRNYLRAPQDFARESFSEVEAIYDFPSWWITQLREEIPEHWEAVLLSSRSHPPMTLRVNRQRIEPEAYRVLLETAGVATCFASNGAIVLEKPQPVQALPKFAEGWVSVQDIGAQMAAGLLEVQDGMHVLDACAAPGGKTGHLLESANIDLLALDSDKQRLRRVSENLKRLQLNATTRCADAAQTQAWWDKRPFQRILVDAPCSGSGVTRRHPDIKWLRRPSDLARFARQQWRLLNGVWPTLAEGGKLLYMTCSVFRAENQEVIARFLKEHPDATMRPVEPNRALATNEAALPLRQDGLLLPHAYHDGFYFALLEKR